MSLIATMMESSATLKRPTIGRDAASGVKQSPFRTVASNLPCSCQQAGASVVSLYAQRQTSVTTTLYFAQDPGAQVNDRLEVTDRTGNLTYYLVRGRSQSVGRGRLWNVDAEFLDGPT